MLTLAEPHASRPAEPAQSDAPKKLEMIARMQWRRGTWHLIWAVSNLDGGDGVHIKEGDVFDFVADPRTPAQHQFLVEPHAPVSSALTSSASNKSMSADLVRSQMGRA